MSRLGRIYNSPLTGPGQMSAAAPGAPPNGVAADTAAAATPGWEGARTPPSRPPMPQPPTPFPRPETGNGKGRPGSLPRPTTTSSHRLAHPGGHELRQLSEVERDQHADLLLDLGRGWLNCDEDDA